MPYLVLFLIAIVATTFVAALAISAKKKKPRTIKVKTIHGIEEREISAKSKVVRPAVKRKKRIL